MSAVASAESAPAAGTTGTLTVSTNRDCTWTASTTANWIAFTTNASGQGDGTVSYRVAENTDPVSRRAMVAVNDAQVPIAQDPAPCRFTVTPASSTIGASGGSLSVHVDAHSGCAWTAASQADWIQVTPASGGNGAGNVTLSISANSGTAARSGAALIAGQTISVVQAAPDAAPPPSCTFTISPSSASIDANAATGSFAVTASSSTCTWSVTSSAPWITVTSAASGSGNATVAWSAAANTGAARSGTLTVDGQTFTISQAAPCVYALNPAGQTFTATGGMGSVSVATSAGCTWTATTTDQWITLDRNASLSGPGSVSFTVAANSGAARSGTIHVAGQTFSVTQDAAPPVCAYTLSPPGASFALDGGQGTFTVITSAACSWKATTTDTWITVAAPGSGTGTGTVGYTVARFSGSSRTGTISVAGQTFTVTQKK